MIRINLAKSAGFCFGVKRALKIALELARKEKNVYMLDDIVHNEEVVRQINKAGLKKITCLKTGKNKILLMRAHGAGRRTFQEAERRGYKIVDATCPMVKEIHRLAIQAEKKSYTIIIIGDKKHEEVRGIVGQLKGKCIIIERGESIPWRKIKKIKKAAVVVQSTQNWEKTLGIVEILKKHIKEIKFFNTICRPTRIKQEEIKNMPGKNDVIIIIGSRKSANTKRLYEISKSLNPRTFWIQGRKEINLNWFKEAKSVGITAGASTPDSTTQEVTKYIKKVYRRQGAS